MGSGTALLMLTSLAITTLSRLMPEETTLTSEPNWKRMSTVLPVNADRSNWARPVVLLEESKNRWPAIGLPKLFVMVPGWYCMAELPVGVTTLLPTFTLKPSNRVSNCAA